MGQGITILKVEYLGYSVILHLGNLAIFHQLKVLNFLRPLPLNTSPPSLHSPFRSFHSQPNILLQVLLVQQNLHASKKLDTVLMGNCLVLQDKKMIKIMRMDGKMLRYQSPLKVHQVLSEFPGHAISDALPVIHHLDPTTDMRSGQLYYLLPPNTPIKETGLGTGVVRIKLVISKQELKDLLLKGGVTLDAMMSLGRREQSNRRSGDVEEKCIGWRPALESIPEGGDC